MTSSSKSATSTSQSSRPCSSRRHTPYSVRPKNRQVSVSSAELLSSSGSATVDPPEVSRFLNQSWKIFRASPLFKFSYNQKSLNRYSRFIESTLNEEDLTKLKNKTVSRFGVSIEVIKNLKLKAGDPDAVQIIITNNKGDEKTTVVQTCILCALMTESTNIPKAKCTYLPLVLMNGSFQIGDSLRKCLKKLFDCHISPVVFSPEELNWMCAMWSGFVDSTDENPNEVKLIYAPPGEIEGLTKITFGIDAHHCQKLWQSVHDNLSRDFWIEEVKSFKRALELHIYCHFKLHLAALKLILVQASSVIIAKEGKVKIFREAIVIPVLRHITTLILEV